MISCGEPSGDLYAGALASEILRIERSAVIIGLGGDRLKAAGASLVGDFSGLSVTGLLEVARVLPRTYATYRRLVADAVASRPDVFVAIDFPDFNFTLGRALHKLGVPIVYYISPQLWAWRRGRMKTMKRMVDRVLVIFPFEEAIYREAGVPVEWVGHPLLDTIDAPEPRERFLASAALDPSRPVVAILPGSRPNEIHAILPDLSRAALVIRERIPGAQFLVARAPNLSDAAFEPLSLVAAGGAQPAAIVEGRADAVLAAADVALVASGTVTVQAAIHECPMVVVYRLSPLTYRLGKPFVRVTTYAMANLVAGRPVVPELIQGAFTPEAVAREALRVLTNEEHASRVRADLREVRDKLGSRGASARAAAAVVRVAREARAPAPSVAEGPLR
ncbi:MAG: lipid-A-disaccharide synthase [Acidobacteria bacterium RIFCSPLOWO2_02_FULL_67_36]|nr:MAG: lipid-A-disaccharide synthase [Acidobacteria bacterium RIFCSPLOWO2_02_FULL_67_36]OFW23663.1 MAG: lipid-A-disaccharide synthase [Acidobacteria bacterium RIFCSPLOWO2_12_FULL_66_21]